MERSNQRTNTTKIDLFYVLVVVTIIDRKKFGKIPKKRTLKSLFHIAFTAVTYSFHSGAKNILDTTGDTDIAAKVGAPFNYAPRGFDPINLS